MELSQDLNVHSDLISFETRLIKYIIQWMPKVKIASKIFVTQRSEIVIVLAHPKILQNLWFVKMGKFVLVKRGNFTESNAFKDHCKKYFFIWLISPHPSS